MDVKVLLRLLSRCQSDYKVNLFVQVSVRSSQYKAKPNGPREPLRTACHACLWEPLPKQDVTTDVN